MSKYSLCSLSFKTTSNYEVNLQTLLTLIKDSDENTIIVAPEVCLSGYDYDNFDAVLNFAPYAIEELKKASHNKIIILTIIERRDNKVYNFAKVFFNGEVIFERAKAKLFRFGDEHKYMIEGSDDNMQIIEVDGIKIAIFICFELRFKDFWQKIEGADVIVVPSYWGVLRTEHFKSLTQTLAIINQCYLIASDSLNDECTKMSGIITPQGIVTRNHEKPSLTIKFSKKEITLMRRYMDVGIE